MNQKLLCHPLANQVRLVSSGNSNFYLILENEIEADPVLVFYLHAKLPNRLNLAHLHEKKEVISHKKQNKQNWLHLHLKIQSLYFELLLNLFV